ncbi:hypothetical protein ACFQPG_10995 [Sphingomonas sp. GCM10030256]|uniref:hypothetical protein n=1 Tax=Sphingomonas sp. GCM10030256 TaxID=3273427 RepID=UPI003609C6FE
MIKKLTDGTPGSQQQSGTESMGTGIPGGSHDAELRDWAFREHKHSVVAFGRVFGDSKGRWPDGFVIGTSAVVGGAPQEGSVITTPNTRYLLSGPPGDLEALLKLSQQQGANAARRGISEQDEQLFDLLQAAWGMDDATFEKVAGLPPRWLWQWRNHYRAPSDPELAGIRRLMRFHNAIRLVTYGEPNYAAWWRRRWSDGSFIGSQSPLDAVLSNPAMMDRLEQYLRAQF